MFRNEQEFLSLLKKVKASSSGQYTACCPAHDDQDPSLSVRFENNNILLHCHAGCSYEEILAALSLKKSNLYIGDNMNNNTNNTNKTVYSYRDENGTLLYERIRYDYAGRKKEIRCKQANGTYNLAGVKRVPYNLPSVLQSDKIYFVEGEKCADRLISLGFTATTLDNGCNSKWQDYFDDYFSNKEIIILPDNDKSGMKYALTVKQHLPAAKVIRLNDLAEKEDVFDWLAKGHTIEEIETLPAFDVESYFGNKVDNEPADTKDGRETYAEQIVRLVHASGVEFIRDTLNNTYAVIPCDDHKELVDMGSHSFEDYLIKLFFDHCGKICKKDTLSQVVMVLTAKAKFDNKKRVKLSTRVAYHNSDIYYNLTNDSWQAVKISPDGWSIENDPPIIFTRFAHHKAQVLPSENGDVSKILNYINISRNETLFLCWLISCFVPDIPHPMPIFYGEKGAAKSTACKFLKRVIDPSELDTLAMPKQADNMLVCLSKHWFLPFDNVSFINDDTSDMLCRVITGDGIQKRKLYSDNDDVIYKFQKCIALNGINNSALRSDLIDRSILVELLRIPEEDRVELSVLEKEFEQDLPFILAGVLKTLSEAMKLYPKVSLGKLPRMADFCRWGYAIAEALGGKGEKFLQEYAENIRSQNIEVLNSDTVANLMMKFMNGSVQKGSWSGSISELYSSLKSIAQSEFSSIYSTDFPKKPNVLSRRLNGMKSNLEEAGIVFRTFATATATRIEIKNNLYKPLPDYRINLSDILGKPINTPQEINPEF